MNRIVRVWVFVLVIAALAPGASSAPARAQDGGDLPTWGDLTPGQWNAIAPGGETRCLYGDPYLFFVRPAEVPADKLMIFFQGGGACWDGETCADKGGFAFDYDVQPDEPEQFTSGVFNYDNPDNPVIDYDTVFVSYCSGDVFSGDAEVTFGDPELTVYFDGQRNTQAVLDWVYANVPDPARVFVTGVSAGGYGATIFAPAVMDHYAGVPAVHLSDGGVGVMPEASAALATWGAESLLDRLLDADAQPETLMTDLVIAAANRHPSNTFAYYTTYADFTQIAFYGYMAGLDLEQGGELLFLRTAQEWASRLREDVARLNADAPNFRSYVAGGRVHTILLRPELYTYTVDGVAVRDWVANLLAGDARSVMCDVPSGACTREPVSR